MVDYFISSKISKDELRIQLLSAYHTPQMTSAQMKALVVQEEKKMAIEQVPIPKPGAGQILIKVVAVAQNPTDC